MTSSSYGAEERVLTDSPSNKVLTNIHCWSPDSRRIVYDVRSAKNGDLFDGRRIKSVDVGSGKTEILYESKNGACCGVVTCSPVDDRVVFIHGPENPDENWSYSFQHRRGVIRYPDGRTETLDACNVAVPLVPGALRGGSHVHVFSGDGQLVSFTYNDHLLDDLDRREPAAEHDFDQRNVGVSVPLRPVVVNRLHPRNHDGSHFSVLVTKTTNDPVPGSDDISKAYEEGWVGRNGYEKPDGGRQKYALAFLGDVSLGGGQSAAEVFIVDLPERFADYAIPGDEPLEGSLTGRPQPPKGIVQRRLTQTTDRKYPGVQGTRHWLRSSPDGSRIAFLMKDDNGVVQLWTVSPNGGEPAQWTQGDTDVASSFSWSPDGCRIAYVMDRSVFVSTESETLRITPRTRDAEAPLALAVVFSPDGNHIAFVRNLLHADGTRYNQVCIVSKFL